MKFSAKLLFLAWLFLFIAHGQAQVPAQPADPNEPRPAPRALPVVPDVASPPAMPAQPAAATSTNAPTAASGPSISIIADGSLKAVLSELAQTWADTQDSSPQMPITLTNAGTLRAKIESGGAWDIVIDADLVDLKAMADKGLLVPESQRSLARNELVVYGRNPLVKDDELDWFDLIGSEWKKVAMGNPDLVASARVAQRALKKHDLLDDDHKGLYMTAPNEAGAIQLLQKQQVDAVFVYKTDLTGLNLTQFQVFPIKPEDAPPLFYAAAISKTAKNPALAQQFLDYISSAASRPIWMKYGFEAD